MAIDMISYAIGAKNGGGGGGGGGGVLVVNAVLDEQTMTTTLDKTWTEIESAVASGKFVYVCTDSSPDLSYETVLVVRSENSKYYVETITTTYMTSNPDSYPYHSDK